MKIRLPNFNLDFSDFDTSKTLDVLLSGRSAVVTDFHEDCDFPFYAVIDVDGMLWSGTWFVYGYISTSEYYDDAFVKSDEIKVKTVKGLISAYKKIEKQLNARYKTWVKEKIYINN